MSQIFNQSPYASGSGQNQVPGAQNRTPGQNFPPPSPGINAEIEIRTMQSDIEQMGGQANAFGNLTFSAPQVEVRSQATGAPFQGDVSDVMPNKSYVAWLWVLVGIGIAGLLFAGGYFLIPKLTAKPTPPPATVNNASSTNAPSLPPVTAPTFLGYKSFAKFPTDGKYEIILTDNATKLGLVDAVVGSAGENNATSALSRFTEVVVKNSEGHALSWASYLKMAEASLLEERLWQGYFEQGFNLFVRWDERGAWPVYVLKLKEGQTKILADVDLRNMEEKSSELKKLFFLDPGSEVTQFESKQVYGESARVLTYSNPGARLVYGWVNSQYFLISTSLESFEEAGRRL